MLRRPIYATKPTTAIKGSFYVRSHKAYSERSRGDASTMRLLLLRSLSEFVR